ncbi:hypothetical protein [Salinigranum marinum]|uniref:hypothetical protein n=1 Tax=Salinigranum marinum TaxID=1515595 RepID=UPI002989E7F4|nr:hypothetical protein [Salinigranum marinum]
MIRGFPDRPLSAGETLTLSHARDDLLVIPATPNSLVGNDGSLDDIRNVLVFTRNVVASLAYTDAGGWTVVSKVANPSAFEDVLDSLIEFRGNSLADEDRDAIVETIAEAYETFTERTLR